MCTFTGLSFGRPSGKRFPSSCTARSVLCLASGGRRSEGIDSITLLMVEIKPVVRVPKDESDILQEIHIISIIKKSNHIKKISIQLKGIGLSTKIAKNKYY
jgi:hypothetical protein